MAGSSSGSGPCIRTRTTIPRRSSFPTPHRRGEPTYRRRDGSPRTGSAATIRPGGRTMCGCRRTSADVTMNDRRIRAVALLAVLLATNAIAAEPYPPYPPPAYPPPRAYRPPPPRVVAPPPPLSPAMRVVYAPFYAAGLVLRYGCYYVLVAPFEVFGRALGYGVEGGVEPPPRPGYDRRDE